MGPCQEGGDGALAQKVIDRVVERYFASLGSDLMRALHGYAGDALRKELDYDGREMAILTVAQLERVLWWYFVDCVPFQTTTRKGAWGSIRHVNFTKTADRYGLLPPISARKARLALGLKVERTVTRMGIEAFRMPFQGDLSFRSWMLENEGARVAVYVDPHSLEEVTLVTPCGQKFYLKASLSQFKDFSLQEWIQFITEWRESDPLTEELAVEALCRFYDRVKGHMTELLDFYGKEHKVIRIEDAQKLADEVAGGLTILHGDARSPSASLDVLGDHNAIGTGVYTPGSLIPAGFEDAEFIDTDAGSAASDGPGLAGSQIFTGKPAGKGDFE